MSGFKLIAITPLVRCSQDFCKNLDIGNPYQFYKNYDILLNDGGKSVKNVIAKDSTIPVSLYELKNGINLNISAVVGKNGSGKSTLFELLFYLMSVIATDKSNLLNRILPYSQLLIDKSKQLEEDYFSLSKIIGHIDGKKLDDYKIDSEELKTLGYNAVSAYFITLIKKHELQIDIKASNSEIDNAIKIWAEIGFQKQQQDKLVEIEKVKEGKIRSELNLSLIYQIGNEIFEIEYIQGKFSHYEFQSAKKLHKNSLEEFNISDLFYSIAINYSHHALNSNTIGNWINQLFHKNDAYITPVVINPMREEGNFNINHELSLSKERLMSNIIFNLVNNKEFKLLDKYKISKFIFTPKSFVSYPMNYGAEIIKDSTLNSLLIEELAINKFTEHIDYWDFAIAYLDKKLKRISENYSFLIYSNKDKDIEDPLLDFIRKDNTHITKKVRQTLNFLKSTQSVQNRNFWKAPEDVTRIELSTEDYLKWLQSFELQLNELKPSDLIEFALPGFFNVDFEFTSDSGKIIEFGKLSSGEQQMILNTNAILYHLYNLQSVHSKVKVNPDATVSRIKYKDVNIVLDEIELYYHPEMQRQLVKSVIDSFENIKAKGENGISSINVCFLTHSPFILSDIPRENVLRLSQDSNELGETSTETLGANIYDLLEDTFFMKEGFIGSYAMTVIGKILNYIDTQEYNNDEQNKMINLAELISDELINAKLMELLEEKEFVANDLSTLSEVARLEAQKKEIDKKINKLKDLDNDK